MFLPCCFAFLAGCPRVMWKAKSTPMPQHSYRERDYTFGQAMFKLRTSIGLTQAGLTDLLWVSSRDKLGQQSTGESAETATRDTLEENRTFAKNHSRFCLLCQV